VAFAILRPDRDILLQSKRHYPERIFRLPTGRLQPGEDPASAVAREMTEETGLFVRRALPLATLSFLFTYRDRRSRFLTYLYLVEASPGVPVPQDASEGILGYRSVPQRELRRYWWALRRLSPPLQAWGKFRATPLAVLWLLARRGRLAI
jgi:ADP-ribose pyrophosphatase YjhB (NUDIX family)